MMRIDGLILTLDVSTHCGFAFGRRGRVERSGVVQLRKFEHDDDRRMARRMGRWMRDQFILEIPELVVDERMMSPAAALASGMSHPNTVATLSRVFGAIDAVCACYDVRQAEVAVGSHRKITTGKERWPGGDPKKKTIEAINRLRLVERTVTDDNEADALSIFNWASTEFAGAFAGRFQLLSAERAL